LGVAPPIADENRAQTLHSSDKTETYAVLCTEL
jgi:hypothetical protein